MLFICEVVVFSWYKLMLCFFKDTATTEIYTYEQTLSLHDALPIVARFTLKTAVAHSGVRRKFSGIRQSSRIREVGENPTRSRHCEWRAALRCNATGKIGRAHV